MHAISGNDKAPTWRFVICQSGDGALHPNYRGLAMSTPFKTQLQRRMLLASALILALPCAHAASHGTSIARGQVGGTTQIRNGGSCRREHYPCPQARRRQGSLFSHIRSPGCGIPQACRGLAEPGGRKNGRAGGKMPSMPALSAPGCPRAVQKVSMRPWPRPRRARGTTRWRTDSPKGVSS